MTTPTNSTYRLTDAQRAEIARGEAIADWVATALAGIAAFGRFLVAALAKRRRARATYRELMSLDARTLADIGLSHSDLARVAAGDDLPRAPSWSREEERQVGLLARPTNANAEREKIAA